MDMYPQGFKANFGLELANTFGVSASIEMVACRWFAGYCVLPWQRSRLFSHMAM